VRTGAALAALAIVGSLAGCGGDDGAASGGGRPQLTVSAAASLKNAFPEYARGFHAARVRFSFGGSDELAAQVRTGAKPDVFAAANTKLPGELFREGRVERPIAFAGNRLVIAVPAGTTGVRSIAELARPGLKLVVGAPGVPVGSYTREVIGRLGASERQRILGNVRSNEPDVSGVVAKLTQGAADAGFVYATDVVATKGGLRAIELPSGLQPGVEYGAAIVKGAKQPEAARAFVDGLLRGRGLEIMRRAGFEPPPD
jgi:molybdate transport system substrate-binding protein